MSENKLEKNKDIIKSMLALYTTTDNSFCSRPGWLALFLGRRHKREVVQMGGPYVVSSVYYYSPVWDVYCKEFALVVLFFTVLSFLFTLILLF